MSNKKSPYYILSGLFNHLLLIAILISTSHAMAASSSTPSLPSSNASNELAYGMNQATPEALYLLAQNYINNSNGTTHYERAIPLFRKAATSNHALAQFHLGCFYLLGRKVPSYYLEAQEWYAKMAKDGVPTSNFNLGMPYFTDWKLGSEANKSALLPKAQSEDAQAQLALGLLYLGGMGVRQDYNEARQWLEIAAKNGVARAQFVLGKMYFLGLGAPLDHYQAITWCREAAKNGYTNAHLSLANLYLNGTYGLIRGSYPDDYGKNAATWYRDQGNDINTPIIVRKIPKDRSTRNHVLLARDHLTKAALKGDANAQFLLGFLWTRGKSYRKPRPSKTAAFVIGFSDNKEPENPNTPLYKLWSTIEPLSDQSELQVNYAKALSWYTKASSQGHPQATTWIGRLYSSGQGVPRDPAMAAVWYNRALTLGSWRAASSLADMYREGWGLPKDIQKSIALSKKSNVWRTEKYTLPKLANGNPCATGLGVQQNYALAAKWLRMAAAQGIDKAQNYLNLLTSALLIEEPEQYAQKTKSP